MEPIRISAKNLGGVMLDTFCPRCFWIKLKNKKLPWQIFPGIFSSIDAYTKKVAHAIIDSRERPEWMKEVGDIVTYLKTPHHTEFKIEIAKYRMVINGVADDIWMKKGGGIAIPDYKTAKYTANQDKLIPMYQVQLEGYAYIGERTGYNRIENLPLIYFQPRTDEETAKAEGTPEGFKMPFDAHIVHLEVTDKHLMEAAEKAREIYEMPYCPEGLEGCKDCQALDEIMMSVIGHKWGAVMDEAGLQ